VYIHFESERSVKSLLLACTHDFSSGGEYYYKVSSRRMRSKEVRCRLLKLLFELQYNVLYIRYNRFIY